RLTPRELETVATAAIEIKSALEPLRGELAEASGSKKGAITKHLNRLIDGLLGGAELHDEDRELVARLDMKQAERARDLGNGLLREVLEEADPDAKTAPVRELATDICMRTDG